MVNFFKYLMFVIAGISASAYIHADALAGSRYFSPPPVILSPNVVSPWVLQLRAHPLPNGYRTNGYHVGVARPVIRRTAPVYRQPVYRQPVYRQPAYNQPVYNQRVYRQPAYQRPVVQRRIFRPATQTRRAVAVTTRTNARRGYNNRAVNARVIPAPTISRKPVRKPVRQASIKPTPKKSSRKFDPRFENQIVAYDSSKKPGTIVIDTNQKFLYLVMGNGQARRYGVGVGKPGFEWAGTHKVTRKAEWPSWNPPKQMIAREKKKGRTLPAHMEGGPNNPLGARALYLGSTLYRIHGTNSPWTIGKAVSSGCIRMRNEDVMDLYERVGVGTRVHVS